MNKPKYLQALELREQGLTYNEIACCLTIKVQRVREYLNKARHLERKLELHRAHCRRYYYKDLEKSREKSRAYWQKDPERWQRERLITVINGQRVTLYHLNKRQRSKNCELCLKLRNRLYYHHWDHSNFSMGMWLCGQCHRFVSRVERGEVKTYQLLKLDIEGQPT